MGVIQVTLLLYTVTENWSSGKWLINFGRVVVALCLQIKWIKLPRSACLLPRHWLPSRRPRMPGGPGSIHKFLRCLIASVGRWTPLLEERRKGRAASAIHNGQRDFTPTSFTQQDLEAAVNVDTCDTIKAGLVRTRLRGTVTEQTQGSIEAALRTRSGCTMPARCVEWLDCQAARH